ncbi:MAG TPA: hypothetical protein PLV92_29095, partial [Pirellulaceae bacterium]|nr:hypothetical protein [Pirellulaceae bacterium]
VTIGSTGYTDYQNAAVGGDVVLGAVSGYGGARAASLDVTAAGDVTTTTASIAATSIAVVAGGSVTAPSTGALQGAALQVTAGATANINTAVDSLTLSAAQVTVVEADSLALNGVSAVGTNGAITLTVGGAVTDGGDARPDLSATSAIVQATAIGTSSNRLETTLTKLEANATAGGIFVANTGGLTIGGIGSLVGLNAAGAIDLSSTGAVTVSEAVSATGAITFTADQLEVTATVAAANQLLTIQPFTPTTTISVGGTAGTLALSDSELTKLSGFQKIVFGDATSGSGLVTIESATLTDPVVFAGGSIDLRQVSAGTSNSVELIALSGGTITDNFSGTGSDITGSTVTVRGTVAAGTSG